MRTDGSAAAGERKAVGLKRGGPRDYPSPGRGRYRASPAKDRTARRGLGYTLGVARRKGAGLPLVRTGLRSGLQGAAGRRMLYFTFARRACLHAGLAGCSGKKAITRASKDRHRRRQCFFDSQIGSRFRFASRFANERA